MSFDQIIVDNNGFVIGLKRNCKAFYAFNYDKSFKYVKESCDDYKCDYYNENDIDLLNIYDNAKDKGCDYYESY